MTEAKPPVPTEPEAVSEAGEDETLAEPPTTQPRAEAEPDAAGVAAEADASQAPGVESPVEQATPEEATTTLRRAAPVPAWAWVAITLMAVLVASGLATLAVVRNANPDTPEAVEDVQTLVVELEALNGYLATTNQLMSDAIANAEYLSANVQAELAGLTSQLADAEAGVGHARSLLGSQLSGTTRSELEEGHEQLQSLQRTLAEHSGQLGERQLAAISRDVAAIDNEFRAATNQGSSRTSAFEARIEALESGQAATDELTTQTAQLRAGAEQLRATLRAQRERARTLAAQLQELKRAQARLRERVEAMTPSPSP